MTLQNSSPESATPRCFFIYIPLPEGTNPAEITEVQPDKECLANDIRLGHKPQARLSRLLSRLSPIMK
jgi:hypothetical protein